MKQIRPNTDIQFYAANETAKVALRTYGPPAVVGERNLSDGLVRIRTLLFPTAIEYENWLVNPVVQANVNDRAAYNKQHGISETHHVRDIVDLDILDIKG